MTKPEFPQHHRDVLADHLATVHAPFAKKVREGSETLVLRAALLAMQDVAAELLTNLADAALKCGRAHHLSAILEAMNGKPDFADAEPVAENVTAVPPKLELGVWHDVVPVAVDGQIPPGIDPSAQVWIKFRDGQSPNRSFPALDMLWTDNGDATIAKVKIVRPEPAVLAADAWRKIPIDAGTLHDLLLSRGKLNPEVGLADTFDTLAKTLFLVAEARARGPQ